MLHPSTQQLIRKLCELTDAGHIAWKEGERQSSRFESEGYIVEVEAEPPALRLLRGDGRELERADAADLASAAWPDGSGTYATHLVAMANKAHRVARGAEAAIARILTSLSSPPKADIEPEPASAWAELNPPLQSEAPASPAPAKVAAEPPAQTISAPKPAFGAVESFDRAPGPDPLPPPTPVRPAPQTLMVRGFSARTVQTPEQGTTAAAASRPAPTLEQKREPPPPVSVYKPWN